MLNVIKYNQVIFSSLSHFGIQNQKHSVQNLTIFFDFCSILVSNNQFVDHIITSSLAWSFITTIKKKAHVPTNLLHPRRIPRKMCFLSLWKSVVPPDFLYLYEMLVPFPYLYNTFGLLIAPRTLDEVTPPSQESFNLSQLPNPQLQGCRIYFNNPILFWSLQKE